ncbi:RsiV family protein [Elizabethkingia occulta]|uniref:RsiV family protein n=1 Tax=Elizabethkingia occulta TaxID=1867263 RepID=UPI00398C33AC
MKNTISSLFVMAILVMSCKKNENTQGTEMPKGDTIVTLKQDSVVYSDSIKATDSLTIAYSDKILVFPDIKEKAILDSLYPFIKPAGYSKPDLEAAAKKAAESLFAKVKKDYLAGGVVLGNKWYEDNSMRLRSFANNYLSVEYTWSSYMGGAHDNYGFMEKVFDLNSKKQLVLSDITSMPKSKLEKLLMKNVDKIPTGTENGEGAVKVSDGLLFDKVTVNDNFYFDDKNLYFHYSPYEIAAFAAGDITIPVSWKELEGTINPEFMKRMKINTK